MKYFLILFLFCANQICAQSKIYELELNTLDSSRSSLKDYSGKKIFIATGSANHLQKAGIKFLDSLQAANPDIHIIVIPMQDSVAEDTKTDIDLIRNNRSKRSLVMAPAYVSEGKNERQNALVKYLTDVKENRHFDPDLNTDFNMYLVSESGYLYAVLSRFTSAKTLNELLHQEDVKR